MQKNPAKKVFVFSNLAISLDGKIGTQTRGFLPLGTKDDIREMMRLRKKADALIIGASTLKTFKKACLVPGATRQPINLLLSTKLQGISPRWNYFQNPTTQKVVFVSQNLSKTCKMAFEKTGAQIVFLNPKRSLAPQILTSLENMYVKSLLVEGGGEVMWQFAKENLIDEFHVTLTPKIIGGKSSPTLIDGEGFAPSEIPSLKLVRAKRIKDELYLIYRKR